MRHSGRGGINAQDRIRTARIMGAANRLSKDRPFDLDAAVAEVREVAGGRADLLAEAAGIYLGTVQSDPFSWYYPLAAQICLDAGADRSAVSGWVERARDRARHSWGGITIPHETVTART